MPGEWLLRFRALSATGHQQQARADSADSADGSLITSIEGDNSTFPVPIGANDTIGTASHRAPELEDVSHSQVYWRELFETRAAARERLNHYTRAAAERRAWGEIENRWHLQHGDRIPRDLCAGCRRPIGNAEALDMIDGNRVHLTNSNGCLIQHGNRWRASATQALIALGLRPPSPAR